MQQNNVIHTLQFGVQKYGPKTPGTAETVFRFDSTEDTFDSTAFTFDEN